MTKQLRLLIILLFVSISTFAQHTFTWQRTYGHQNLDDFADDILQTDAGDYVFTGSANGLDGNNYDIYLVKTDRVGNVLWTRYFGGEGMDKGAKMLALSDGGFAIVGMTQSFGQSDSDVYFVRTDSEGQEVWSMTYRQPNTNEEGLGVAATADGGFILSGFAETADGDEELYLMKTRSDGSVQWSNMYGGVQDERGYAVTLTQDGGYAVAGFTQSIGSGKKDGFLLRTDFLGNEIWARPYGNGQNNVFYDLIATDDGGFVMTGYNEFAAYVSEDMYIVRTDANGSTQWSRSFGGSFKMTGYSITAVAAGGYLVVGERSFPEGSVSKDIHVIRLSETGFPMWEKSHGGQSDENALAVAPTADGGFIVAGWQKSVLGVRDMDAYLLKMNFAGQIDTTFTVIVEQSESFTCHGEDSGSIDVWVTGGQYPYTYEWNRDGLEGFHLYGLSAGNYRVTVTGADNQVVIHQSSFTQPPELLLTASPSAAESCAGNADGRAFAFASGGTGNFTYLWDNGGTEAFVTQLSAGLHHITVTDENGCTKIAAVVISAGPDGEPTATFDFQTHNLNLTFVAEITGVASEIKWNFGDGRTSNQTHPSHSFAADGTYQVCLTVGNSCGETQTCQSISVFSCSDDPLSASFEAHLHSFTATFSHPSSASADSHFWDFGDGHTSSEAEPSHTFTSIGDYEICLTVNNLCGELQHCSPLSIVADSTNSVVFQIESIRSLQDTTVNLPVYVHHFKNVLNFQGSINIEDLQVANFKSVIHYNLPNMDADNFFLESANVLTFNWIDATGQGLTVDDGTPIFMIELVLPGESGACTPLYFSDMTLPLKLQRFEHGTLIESPIQTVSGEVCRIDRVSINGNIKRENGTPINEVAISCLGNSYLSNFDGAYDLVIPAGVPCELSPNKNVNHANGVSTLDIVLIRKHILNVDQLDSPYKMIAADVNGSGTISGLDMVIIRKLVLNEIEAFPAAPSWRFIPADFTFPTPENPFATAYPLSIALSQTDRDFSNQDFIAIKTGDVNYTAFPNLTDETPDDRAAHSIVFEVPQQTFQAKETLRCPLYAKDFNQVTGFQFDINIDTEIAEFQKIIPIELSDFDSYNFHYKNGLLAISWTAADVDNGQTLTENAVLAYLEFKTLKNGQVSDVLSLHTQRILAEAYDKNLAVFNLELIIKDTKQTTTKMDVSVYPNPVQTESLVSCHLPEAGFFQLDLFDSKGRVIKTWWFNNVVDKGRVEQRMDWSDLESGVYYLVLQSADDRVVHKVVKIH